MSKQTEKGFTIIEVVLVLAIAGLIFLMVFVALPALQRSQRDTQRREDISRLMSQINSYQTNNNGNVPAATAAAISNSGAFADAYLKRADGEFKDPQSGEDYTFSYRTDGTATTKQVQYGGPNTRCDGENIVSAGNQSRSVAARIQLEGSGYYCQDNQ